MVRIVGFFIAMMMIVGVAFAAPLTQEQEAWVKGLSSERVAKLMQMERVSRMNSDWDSVTRFQVTEVTRTSRVVSREPVDSIPWSRALMFGESLTVWYSVATPRHARTPVDVRMKWYHEGSSDPDYVVTLTVDQPSPRYRTWATKRPGKRGNWKIEISSGGDVYARYAFVVR